ncbi:MAG TPA: hypothetical protein VGP90_04160 [Acidimicrobiia bacterium]|nr:hypothetical protein [Acidimicrobiia bacterium]
MRRGLAAAAVLAVVGVTAVTPGSAWPEAAGPSGGPAEFSAEVFAAPSYHLVEIPKVEEGGEGFAWAYLNQQPEGWGRAISFWPGPTGDTVARSSTPQDGPLAGHGWKSPGAWTSYPPGGESAGGADFGEPAKFPTGPATETPGGTMRILSFSSHARADETVGDFAFGDFTGSAVPVSVGFARSFARSARENGAAQSTGWALAHDVRLGDVTIDEVRSDAGVRATAAGETGTWTLTIAGVTVAGQRLAWTDHGVSFAPGSESALAQLNEEMAKGADNFRSQFQLVPGRIWHDKDGTHVQSGFLAMGHRPVVLDNNPGQKLSYALSVVSARAIYHREEPEVDAGLGDELPSPPSVDVPPAPLPVAAPVPSVGAPPVAQALGPPVQLGSGDLAGPALVGSAGGATGLATAAPATGGGVPEVALAVGSPGGVRVARAAPVATSFGRSAARSLRRGIGLVALAGLAAAAAVLRAARRQLSLIGSSGEKA